MGIEPQSPGTESQSATNELQCTVILQQLNCFRNSLFGATCLTVWRTHLQWGSVQYSNGPKQFIHQMVRYSSHVFVLLFNCLKVCQLIDLQSRPRWSSGLSSQNQLRSWMRSAVRISARVKTFIIICLLYSIFIPSFQTRKGAPARLEEKGGRGKDDAGNVDTSRSRCMFF